MSELCPFWIKKNPSLEIVLLMIGVLEDPFATSDLIVSYKIAANLKISNFCQTFFIQYMETIIM